MSVKDHSGYFHAGAEALKRLAARCGEARLAKMLENQAERLGLMADASARNAAAASPPPAPVVAAKRPTFSARGLRETDGATRRRANVVELASARERRGR